MWRIVILLISILIFLSFVLPSHSRKDFIKAWESNPKIQIYGEKFLQQKDILSISLYRSGYSIVNSEGFIAYILPEQNLFQLQVNYKNSTKKDFKDLQQLLSYLRVESKVYKYWTNAINELNTYKISKSVLAYKKAGNYVYISSRTKAPFFDALAKGWFYTQNEKEIFKKEGFWQLTFDENDNFELIYEIVDNWYYGVEKK